jgi:hypothetical protein
LYGSANVSSFDLISEPSNSGEASEESTEYVIGYIRHDHQQDGHLTFVVAVLRGNV